MPTWLLKPVGLVAPIVQFWDRPSGEKIAEFDHGILKGETDYPFVVQCEQFKLVDWLYCELAKIAGVGEVRPAVDDVRGELPPGLLLGLAPPAELVDPLPQGSTGSDHLQSLDQPGLLTRFELSELFPGPWRHHHLF